MELKHNGKQELFGDSKQISVHHDFFDAIVISLYSILFLRDLYSVSGFLSFLLRTSKRRLDNEEAKTIINSRTYQYVWLWSTAPVSIVNKKIR